MPLYIAPLFLEPLLPSLVARLLDTSQKVRHKALETTLEARAEGEQGPRPHVCFCIYPSLPDNDESSALRFEAWGLEPGLKIYKQAG